MSGNFFHKYPYTNYHELNLDWILSKIDEFSATLKSWEELAKELQEGLAQIDGMQDEIDALQTSVNDLYRLVNDLHVEDILIDIAKLKTAVSELTNKDIDLQNQINNINQMFDVVNAKFNQVYVYIDGEISKVYAYVNEQDALIIAKINQLKVQLLSMINELAEEIASIDTDAINPWHPELDKVSYKKNLELSYADLADNVPTAEEYSKLDLTATNYAALEIPAIKYSRFGKKLLHLDYVFSPIYGWKQNISNVLTNIVDYFAGTYTADEYASLDLSADDYAAIELTALQYYHFNQDRAGVFLVNNVLQSNQYALSESNGFLNVVGADAVLTDGVLSCT